MSLVMTQPGARANAAAEGANAHALLARLADSGLMTADAAVEYQRRLLG